MKNIEKGKTKIVATIGPASESEDTIRSLILRGMDIARLNTKHNEPSWHMEMVRKIRKISNDMGSRVGILLDLQGPEIRVENYNKQELNIVEGVKYYLVAGVPQGEFEMGIPFVEVIDSLKTRQIISINDGSVSFYVNKKGSKRVELIARNSFVLGHRKTINIPGLSIDIPSLTKRDLEYLEIIKHEPVDFIGLSFIRSKKDILILKNHLTESKSDAHIIAKIETKLALKNIDEIIESADALMIARDDLGIENPIEEIAYWQKRIIKLCRHANKPVIVATQMLKSMTVSPMPTRAEATDIANAVFDGTDAIMLSEETASGKFPERSVAEMAKIAHFNEKYSDSGGYFSPAEGMVTDAFAKAAAKFVEDGEKIGLSKIIVFTDSGFTARAISSFRPKYEIVAVTDRQTVANQMSLVYGVKSYLTSLPDGEVHLEDIPFDKMISEKIIKKGDGILVIHGSQWKKSGTSSLLAFIRV